MQRLETCREPWTRLLGARGDIVIEIACRDTRREQGIPLEIKLLFSGRDPHISDELTHVSPSHVYQTTFTAHKHSQHKDAQTGHRGSWTYGDPPRSPHAVRKEVFAAHLRKARGARAT